MGTIRHRGWGRRPIDRLVVCLFAPGTPILYFGFHLSMTLLLLHSGKYHRFDVPILSFPQATKQ